MMDHRPTGLSILLKACALTAALAGSGCAETTGDFGRRPDNIWTNTILPKVGYYSAQARSESVSDFPLTDDEIEMRNRAYQFVAPAHERAWFDKALAELRYTRILPIDVNADPSTYFRALTRDTVVSVASRYQRLRADVDADRALTGPYLAVAKRVRTDDGVRTRALASAGGVTEDQRQNALMRNAENEQLNNWVCTSLRARVAGYRYAIEHLVIEGPQREAVPAERAVIAMENDPRSLCMETVPLIDPDRRNPLRGLDRPNLRDDIHNREVPVLEQPIPPAITTRPLLPPTGGRPLVTKD